ncbi:MAG TPA: AI-2E family transporter, partial [Myxococcaceae bacterium]|nr:AI-2E family transporter [Myxococcaceae bacterium]
MIRALKTWKRPLALALSLLLAWALWIGLVKAQNVVLLGFLAILVAVLFSFPVGWLSRLVPRAVAVVVTVLLTFGMVGGVVALATPIVVDQGKQLMDNLPDAARRAEAWLRRAQRDKTVRQFTNGKDVAGTLKAKVPEAVETVATLTPMMAGRVVELTSTFVLLVVLAAFLVYRPSLYERGIRAMLPRSFEEDFDELWERLGQGLRGWVGGTIVAMVLMGTITAVGLFACGIEGWALLGLLTFFGTFVPYVGAVSSSVPGLLVGLSQSPNHFFLALGVYVGVHVIEGYLVQPLVMRRAVEANPALQLFFQALMGALFGLLGLIVATPLLTVLQIVVTTLWIEGRLHKKAPSDQPPSAEGRAGARSPA